jgi:hypothetical protein
VTSITSCTDTYALSSQDIRCPYLTDDGDDRDIRIAEAGMRVLGLCIGLTLLLSVEPGITAQNAPTDARRSEATAVADALIKQSGTGQLAPDTRGAAVAVPRTATMTIAPAPVVDSGDEMFIGTGDGSNGFWVRP